MQKELELAEAKRTLSVYLDRIKELSEPVTARQEAAIEQKQLLDSLRHTTILTSEDWDEFRDGFNKVYDNFLYKIKIEVPNLTQTDMRIISLSKLGLDNRQSAHALGVSLEAIKKAKQRLKAKLSIFQDNKCIEEILLNL